MVAQQGAQARRRKNLDEENQATRKGGRGLLFMRGHDDSTHDELKEESTPRA